MLGAHLVKVCLYAEAKRLNTLFCKYMFIPFLRFFPDVKVESVKSMVSRELVALPLAQTDHSNSYQGETA